MSDLTDQPDRDRCRYPGCTRARRPDAATGRPSGYCEQADEAGGPLHNRTTAWRARQAQRSGVATAEETGTAAPVSLARATLEQRLDELPARLAELRGYLDDVVTVVRTASDVEAAGAEVEDAHRNALTKVTEAEGRSSAAERATRAAEERARVAEMDREEADAVAAEARAETERVRAETHAAAERLEAQTAAAVDELHAQLTAAETAHLQRLAERDQALDQARQDVAAAQASTAAAEAAHQAAAQGAARERDTSAQLRAELAEVRRGADDRDRQHRADVEAARQSAEQATSETATARIALAAAQTEITALQTAAATAQDAFAAQSHDLERERTSAATEREALRRAHADQLAQVERSAQDRAEALSQALQIARETAATLRDQLPHTAKAGPSEGSPTRRTRSKPSP